MIYPQQVHDLPLQVHDLPLQVHDSDAVGQSRIDQTDQTQSKSSYDEDEGGAAEIYKQSAQDAESHGRAVHAAHEAPGETNTAGGGTYEAENPHTHDSPPRCSYHLSASPCPSPMCLTTCLAVASLCPGKHALPASLPALLDPL